MTKPGKDFTFVAKKYPIPSTCLLLILIAGITFYFRSDLLSEALAKLDERSAELKRYKSNIAASAQLDVQLATLQKASGQLQTAAIHITELAKNPQFFYSLERETGVKLTDVRQMSNSAPKGPMDSFIIVPFTVTAEGDYTSLLTFLKRLEFGNNVVRISSASITPTQQPKISLSLTVDVLGLR